VLASVDGLCLFLLGFFNHYTVIHCSEDFICRKSRPFGGVRCSPKKNDIILARFKSKETLVSADDFVTSFSFVLDQVIVNNVLVGGVVSFVMETKVRVQVLTIF